MSLKLEIWQFYALGSAIFASLTAIFGKVGVMHTNAELATVIRTIVILFFLTSLVTYNKGWADVRTIDQRGALFLVLSGLATGLSWLCYYKALKIGPASQVAPLDKLSLVLTIIFAIAFLGEKLSGTKLVAVIMIAAGTVLLSLP